MENKKEQEMEQDDIVNLEQFQVGRAPEDEKQPDEQDDAEYTEDEVEFADGEGTQLDEELGDDDIDTDDIDTEEVDTDDVDTDDLEADDVDTDDLSDDDTEEEDV